MGLKKLFGLEKPHEEVAFSLYGSIVAQARQPYFYSELGVPDTIDGRYDMIIVHAFLIFHRLKDEDEAAQQLAQVVFDTMFRDFDQSLREMGVGDMGVGPRIKKMASSFYGRVGAYDKALEADDNNELEPAIARNIFNKIDVSDLALKLLATYMRSNVKYISEQKVDDIKTGTISYLDPETLKKN